MVRNYFRTAGIVCVTLLLAGCSIISGPRGSTTTPVVQPSEASTQASTQAATAAPTKYQPQGDLGVVDINQNIVDDGLGYTILVQKANTVWIPAMPQWPDDTSGAYVRMLGIRIHADGSQVKYSTGNFPIGEQFNVVAADGTSVQCADFLRDEESYSYSIAILGALGGDAIFDYNPVVESGDGWIYCMTSTSNDASFNTPGYTLHYVRPADQTDSGDSIPEFTYDIPITF